MSCCFRLSVHSLLDLSKINVLLFPKIQGVSFGNCSIARTRMDSGVLGGVMKVDSFLVGHHWKLCFLLWGLIWSFIDWINAKFHHVKNYLKVPEFQTFCSRKFTYFGVSCFSFNVKYFSQYCYLQTTHQAHTKWLTSIKNSNPTRNTNWQLRLGPSRRGHHHAIAVNLLLIRAAEQRMTLKILSVARYLILTKSTKLFVLYLWHNQPARCASKHSETFICYKYSRLNSFHMRAGSVSRNALNGFFYKFPSKWPMMGEHAHHKYCTLGMPCQDSKD